MFAVLQGFPPPPPPPLSTGFSPFELVNGRNLRGPLEAIKEEWLSGKSVVEWVEELKEILARLHGKAVGNCKRKEQRIL